MIKQHTPLISRLDHPHILQLYGYFHDRDSVYLVLEHAKGGELYRDAMSRRRGNKLDEKTTARYIRQVALALRYLQSHHIAHRDIKPENLLLSNDARHPSDDQSSIKLCDFGWAIYAPPPVKHLRRTLCGTPEYVPPEMLSLNCYSNPSYDVRYVDIWAIGVLALEMTRGVTPFACGEDNEDNNDAIFSKIRKWRDVVVGMKGETDALLDFVRRLLRRDPGERISVREVLCHEWLNPSAATM